MIRRCTKTDIDLIYDIEEKAFASPLKRETMLKDMERESHYCYALFTDTAVSFVSFEKVFDEGQIISVATKPGFTRKGYARTLFEKVCEEAKKEGIEFFTLEVRCDNIAAVALYKALGFKEVGIRKNYYSNPVCDAILMDLHLGDEKDGICFRN